MQDLTEATQAAPASEPPTPEPSPSPRRWTGVLFTILATGALIGTTYLPQPARGILGILVAVGWPALAWFGLATTRLGLRRQPAAGLGLMAALASWTLWEFVLIWMRAGVDERTSYAVFAISSLIPVVVAGGGSPLTLRAVGRTVSGAGRAIADRWKGLLLLAILLGAGASLVAVSMGIAERPPYDKTHFHVFWIGLGLIMVPLFVLAATTAKRWSSLVIVLLAAGSYLPVFVRAPLAPLMFDELAHWGEAQQILLTGRVFEIDSVVAVGPLYPGLETLTVGLAQVTGIPIYSTGSIIILLTHIAALLAVAQLARTITGGDERVAVVAAAIYGIAPSFLRLDSWYAYESLAIPMALWMLNSAIQWSRKPAGQGKSWAFMTLVLGTALVITHHLTVFALAAVLLLAAICALPRRGRLDPENGTVTRWLPLGLSAILLAVTAVVWAVAVGAPLVRYLGVFPQTGLSSLVKVLTGQSLGVAADSTDYLGKQQGTRGLFGGSLLPQYEQWLAFAAQPVLFVWFCCAVWRLRGRLSALRFAFALLGFLYFLSLPFLLIAGASPGAHRSWATSFIGLAVTLPAVLLERPAAHAGPNQFRRRLRPLLPVFLSVVLVGNYAAAASAYEQFPGPFVLNTDGRNVTGDMIRSAQWFAENEGRNQRILTNSRTIAVFGAYASALQPPYPTWEIFYPTGQPEAKYVGGLAIVGVKYIVVDRRLATDIPNGGHYFNLAEPKPPSVPLPTQSIAKFDTLKWLTLIHRDDNISIYQVNLPAR